MTDPDLAALGRVPERSVPLVAVELVRVRLPLRRALVAAHGTESVREVVLVRAVDADGVEGWGECSALAAPTYTPEYTDGAWAVLRDHLVPALLHDPAGVPPVVGHPMAAAALGAARLDLALRIEEVALVDTLAALVEIRRGAGLAWTAVLAMTGDPAVAVDEAAAAVAAGATALKLKIRPSAGCERVLAALLEAFPDLPLAVDANGSFRGDRGQLLPIAALLAASPPGPGGRTDGSPRRYVEQPLAADDLLGHAELAGLLAVPVALDESIDGSGALALAAHVEAAALINLKPARLGGIAPAVDLFTDPDRRPEAFLGGMLETGVGRAAALAVGEAVGLDATDVGPSSWYFAEDVTDPVELGPGGTMQAPAGPGIGVVPRDDRLAEVAVDRVLIRR